MAAIPVSVGAFAGVGMLLHQLIPTFDDFLVTAIAVIWGPALGVVATVRVMRHVSFEQPLSARVRLVRTELRRWSRPRPTVLEVRAPRITTLARPAARGLGWIDPPPVPLAPLNPWAVQLQLELLGQRHRVSGRAS